MRFFGLRPQKDIKRVFWGGKATPKHPETVIVSEHSKRDNLIKLC